MSDQDIKTPKEAAMPPDVFSNEDEIKILERRLNLLRQEANKDVVSSPVQESEPEKEMVERPYTDEAPHSAPPLPPAPQLLRTDDGHFHATKVNELKTYESDKHLK